MLICGLIWCLVTIEMCHLDRSNFNFSCTLQQRLRTYICLQNQVMRKMYCQCGKHSIHYYLYRWSQQGKLCTIYDVYLRDRWTTLIEAAKYRMQVIGWAGFILHLALWFVVSFSDWTLIKFLKYQSAFNTFTSLLIWHTCSFHTGQLKHIIFIISINVIVSVSGMILKL